MEHLDTTFLWQQLIDSEIRLIRPDSRAILDRHNYTYGKRSRMDSPTSTFNSLDTMLGVFQLLWRRNIGSLPSLLIETFTVSATFSTGTRPGNRIKNPVIRIYNLPQRKIWMTRLAAAFSFPFLTQTLWNGTFENGGRWLTAVMAIFIDDALKSCHLFFERIKTVDKHRNKTNDRIFPLPVVGLDISWRHLSRHVLELLIGTIFCIVSSVNMLYFKESATLNVVAYI